MEFQVKNSISLVYKNLKRGHYEVKPFKTYKTWKFASDHSENFIGYSTFYETSGIKIYRALYPQSDQYFGNVINISSSVYEKTFTTQSIDPKLIWYKLDHTYYDNFSRDSSPVKIFGLSTRTELYESSSVIIIPQRVFGETIKPGSVDIKHYGSESKFSYTLIDDSNNNLIDTGYDSSKNINFDYCILNLGFNEQYRSYGFSTKQTNGPIDYSNVNNEIVYVNPKKISYTDGIPTHSPISSSGTSAILHGGYFQVKSKEKFNMNPRQNFAISFWINIPVSQSNYDYSYNYIINKSKIELGEVYDPQKRKITTGYLESFTNNYPFDIKINNSSDISGKKFKLAFSRSSGTQKLDLITNSQIPTGSWTHVVCQKSGSFYGIYLNGILDASQSMNIEGNVSNNHEMYIGGEGTNSGMISASLDELRIYKTSLTNQQIQDLSDNSFEHGYAYQTNIVGNVFYQDGIIVVSDPRPKYKNSLLGKNGNYDYNGRVDGFSGTFKSTLTLYEHEIICKIRKNEFNFTQNPTIINGEIPKLDKIKSFATSSTFNPYFTTIGLYNSKYELMAIAKLSSPLEKRDDVDMNVIIRFDV